MNIAIVHTPSPGFKLDARIIAGALGKAIAERNARLLFIEVPVRAVEQAPDLIRRQIPIEARIDIAIVPRTISQPSGLVRK
jgi:hypothetical protein